MSTRSLRRTWTGRCVWIRFSTFRAGFDVRTYRRCRRVLVFHHFPGEPDVGVNCLVRSADFRYSDEEVPADPRNPVYTFLHSVTQTGYRRQGDGYLQRSMPPLEFEYSQPVLQSEVRSLDKDSLANLPVGLDGSSYQWADLDGEGLSGILTDFGGEWGYKRNLSPLGVELPDGRRALRARFGPIEPVATVPSRSELAGRQQLLDLSGEREPGARGDVCFPARRAVAMAHSALVTLPSLAYRSLPPDARQREMLVQIVCPRSRCRRYRRGMCGGQRLRR
jgi:hypothetical protein